MQQGYGACRRGIFPSRHGRVFLGHSFIHSLIHSTNYMSQLLSQLTPCSGSFHGSPWSTAIRITLCSLAHTYPHLSSLTSHSFTCTLPSQNIDSSQMSTHALGCPASCPCCSLSPPTPSKAQLFNRNLNDRDPVRTPEEKGLPLPSSNDQSSHERCLRSLFWEKKNCRW